MTLARPLVLEALGQEAFRCPPPDPAPAPPDPDPDPGPAAPRHRDPVHARARFLVKLWNGAVHVARLLSRESGDLESLRVFWAASGRAPRRDCAALPRAPTLKINLRAPDVACVGLLSTDSDPLRWSAAQAREAAAQLDRLHRPPAGPGCSLHPVRPVCPVCAVWDRLLALCPE